MIIGIVNAGCTLLFAAAVWFGLDRLIKAIERNTEMLIANSESVEKAANDLEDQPQ